MTLLQAILLGIIQGITEFFPVSSSAHLLLLQRFFDLPHSEQTIAFSVICHLGTLTALLIYFKSTIYTILTKQKKVILQLALALLPLFFIAAFLKQIKELYDSPLLLGPFFLITATALYIGIKWGRDNSPTHTYRDPLCIGASQAIAIFPGISRSGLTISMGRLLGWSWNEAITFSFLLAAPTIIGASAVELMHLQQAQIEQSTIGLTHYLAGFSLSFLVGFATLKTLFTLATNQKMMYFVWYCLIIGTGTTLYSIMNV